MSNRKLPEIRSLVSDHRPADAERAGGTPTRRGFWVGRNGPPLLILAVALAHSVLYVMILPPWQHYDEPTHFEYVRLIVEQRRLPREGEYDLAMREKIAASMRAFDFWKGIDAPSIPSKPGQPPGIGQSELGHPPLYYLLQAPFQAAVANQRVEIQLYLARLVSALFFVATVAAAHGFVAEAFPQRRWLPVSVAAFVALLPPLADLMSAVNNDVGAIAFSTLFLWAAVRWMRRGPSFWRVAVTLLLAGSCLATKDTAGLVAVVVLPILAMALLPDRHRPRIWAGLSLLVVVALLLTLRWRVQAAWWYSDDRPGATNRVRTKAPLGHWAFLLAKDRQDSPQVLFQEVPRTVGLDLQGRTVTVGAWIKVAEGEGRYAALSLDDGITLDWRRVEATPEWHFYAFTSTLSMDAPGVSLSAIVPHREAAREIYVDGLVLVGGEMPVTVPPQFDTEQGVSGLWGGRPFTNLVRNGSAESSWPGLKPRLATLEFFRSPAALILHSLWDGARTGWVYKKELVILFRSFWGRFAWSHVALPAPFFYPLAVVSVAGLLGAGLGLLRRVRGGTHRNSTRRHIWTLLMVAVLASWGATVLRVHPLFLTRQVYWPVARYAFVSIAPTATLLCLGLSELMPRRWEKFAWAGFLALATLSAAALWTVIHAYYG